MVKIDQIHSSTLLDSRGQETIEVCLRSASNKVYASVPAGKSKGEHEASVVTARVARQTIASLSKNLLKKDFDSITSFDHLLLGLDGTNNKSKLGANTTLALSIAFIKLFASINHLPLYQILGNLAGVRQPSFPRFFCNLINGGLHADPKYHPLPFQEYLVIPRSTKPSKSLELIFEFIRILKRVLKDHQTEIDLGDEGGFIVSGNDPELGLKLLSQAYSLWPDAGQFDFGLDAAASSLYQSGRYTWNGKGWSPEELRDKYIEFQKDYPLLSIEDPFYQESFSEWAELKKVLGSTTWIVGDDLTVTNSQRIQEAERNQSANAVIIKPNQIGTITETIAAIKLARSYGWKIIISHRSGETMDTFIADLAFGVAADGLKSGSPLQKERLVKYQRLTEIEKGL